ncbi:MAG TPA: glycoside hydrolase family 20 zincin-like fold domain-containing protein [Bacteroidota bacterium]|nr:glycoside hydrolase family 20 zincin-like fold domain-containing protein [Bacteroidota bacterium]
MKTTVACIVCLLLLSVTTEAQEESTVKPSIIPTPQLLVVKNLRFKLTGGTKIVLGSDAVSEQFTAEQLNDEIAARGGQRLKVAFENSLRKLPASFIYIGSPSSEFGRALLKERKGILTPDLKEEGYFLDVEPGGIVLIGESSAGRFYAVMSLSQILQRERRSLYASGVSITDFPKEKMRGISDDISRGQVSTLDNFEKIIRFLARYKMNTYSPYIEDVFSFANHPLIGRGRGALTAAEVRTLDAYAKKFHVDLVPTFETLGHWENILAKPEYLSYAEFPGAQTLKVGDEKTYALLDEMIGELSHAFSSPYFNMGADESWDVGLGSNRDRVAKEGIASVHADHYRKVAEIVKKYGKKPMMYGDIILNNPAILKQMPNDIVIVDWHYDPEFTYPSAEVFRKAGFRFVASPAVWNFTGPFPDFFGSSVNIQRFNADAFANGALGLLTSNWNDYGGEELRELNYYGYAWSAECAWHPEGAEIGEFDSRFFKEFFGVEDDRTIRSVYGILASPGNAVSWQEMWRHPMLPLRPESLNDGYLPILERVASIKSTMPVALALIEEAKGVTGLGAEQLRYLTFVAKLNLWFAEKIEAGEKIKAICNDAGDVARKDSAAALVSGVCDDVVKRLLSLKGEFERLWLATNESAGLELLLARYDRQAAYWKETAEQVKRGNFTVDPQLPSQWIFDPAANPGNEKLRQVQRACFRKVFVLPKGSRSAIVQVLASSYARISLNGTVLGEVYVRRSNSLSLEKERVKLFDVLHMLKDTSNTLGIEVESYEPGSSAGTNVYAEFRLADGSVRTLMSDSTWSVSENPGPNWLTSSGVDSTWRSAAAKPLPMTIVKPNFEAGRGSWIER